MPLFNKIGCSNRSCHGSFQGQGGFRLSLFGYDPALDHEQLKADGGRGRRANPEKVDDSLALRKPLEKLRHGGGRVLHEGTWQHTLLRRWIADGAPYKPGAEPYLSRLEVFRKKPLTIKKGIPTLINGEGCQVARLSKGRTSSPCRRV